MVSTPAPEGAAFLADLAAGGPLKQNIALVVAHPDDEAIGAGGQLHRMQHLTLIVASDGAPRDGRDMSRLGFEDPQAYAKARRDELAEAMRAGARSGAELIQLDLPDGELIFALDPLVNILAETFTRRATRIVMTHAYEGGHPDHDAMALAARLASRRCAPAPIVIEMPYYRAGPQGWALQTFIDEEPASVRLDVDGEAWTRKIAMIDAHRTQADMLKDFRRPIESFRLAPEYRFARFPNSGRLLYRDVAPGLDPEVWLAHARAALAKEGGA